RGQLLSLDALVALIMVIFILSAVTTASQNLRSGLSSMLGWYERTNIAGNMLDVLVNSPGEPSNWNENLTLVRVPGLRSTNGQYLDYQKVEALFEGARSGNPALLNALWNLSGLNDFQLSFYFVNSSVKANYSISSLSITGLPSVLELCSIAQAGTLPNDTSIVLYCPNGTFEFTHTGVSYNYYGNPYSICVLSGAFVGNNFNLYVGQTFSVNGSLGVGSDGTLNTTSLYVNGNLTVANTGTVTASNVAYINGNLYIAGAGNVADVGTIYVYGTAFIGNSGFLNVTGSAYISGNTTISSYGVVRIDGSLYEYSNITLSNGASATVGGETYIGGNLLESGSATLSSNGSVYVVGNASFSSATLSSNGSIYINGPVYIGNAATINATGDVYINGTAVVYGKLVGRNIYVNGNLIITGSTGRVLAYNNLVVNGSVVVQGPSTGYPLVSGNSTVVSGNLIINQGYEIGIGGSLYVAGNLTAVKSVGYYPNTRIVVGDNLIVNEYLNISVQPTSLTVGKNAYIGYQVYSNGTITIKDGSLFVYYKEGYYYSSEIVLYPLPISVPGSRYYFGVELGPKTKFLHINGGYLYFFYRRWYALEGTFVSNNNYDMTGYKLGRNGWIKRNVRITNLDRIWFIYVQYNWRRDYYISPIALASRSSYYVTADIVIDPNGLPLVEPNSTLPSFPAYANISSSSWIYSLPPLPAFQLAVCPVLPSSPTVSINVTYVNVSYVYPSLSQLGSSYFQISMVNGSLVNSSVSNASRANAKWVEQASGVVAVRTLIYSKSYNITQSTPKPKVLYGGMLSFAPMGYLEIQVPSGQSGNFTIVSTYTGESYSGYSVLAVVSVNGTTAYGFASSEVSSCRVKVSGNTVLVPWECLVPYLGVNDQVTFLVWAYSMGGYSWVSVNDLANMNVYMKPVYNYAMIKVLVWR
ncbi:MAG: hypothetical protein GXO39_01580, partial [Thermotogae bacterium]|nr:hypothetical protein [Thermotogota bacterium]